MPDSAPAQAAPARPGAAAAGRREAGAARNFATIEVEGLEKTFRIPRQQVHTLKERALHPLRRTTYDELNVLRGVSFDVAEGEFFGIVGRNGSGKSTLLKCLAGIYRADAGEIRVAGNISPFIELGAGFNPDLTARDNVVINAVMMGLTPREARARFDAIIEFAELQDFVDLKLKNYSSGMQVRLAFAVMVQSGSEILLIDEVLAVGDAAFQQRCLDEFARLRDEGRTIVLVTHDMEMVERFCHRAMLITDGEIELMGDPGDVGRRYLERNFERLQADPGAPDGGPSRARVVEAWIENENGMRVDAAAPDGTLHLRATFEALGPVHEPVVDFWVDSDEGQRVFGTSTRGWQESAELGPGERLNVSVDMENRLGPGRYHIGCSLLSGRGALQLVTMSNRAKAFDVYGDPGRALLRLDHDLRIDRYRTS